MGQNFPLFPDSASSVAGQVDALYFFGLGIAAFFSILIGVLILALAVKYRRRSPDQIGQREKASNAIEIAWSVIPLLILLFMFTWGARVFFTLSRPPVDAVEYYAIGKQWMWKFQHPEGTREINELHVPVGQAIRLRMGSEDVIHSFFVPAFRVKADVIPGRYTTVWFKATKPGAYYLFCAEYCGAEHSRMTGQVIVMEPHDYEAWLTHGNAGKTVTASGAELFDQLSCNTCHRADSNVRAPLLQDLYGRRVHLHGGDTLLADDNYIRESILDPAAKLVAGYQPIMPTFKGQVTEDQLLQLIAYIKSLGAAQANSSPAPAPDKG